MSATTLVKICGLSEAVSLDAAIAAGADMVGFVFFPNSPRHVPLDKAAALVAHVAARAAKVLLTVDADDALLAAAIAAFAPDLLQLHGRETPARVAAVRVRFGLPVMKAIGLAEQADLAQIAHFDAVADRLLFDAKPAPQAALPGGNGAHFDWRLLRGVATAKPWMLAGGLTPENVADAVATTGAFGVDVSSGVECRPGVKDLGRIAAFMAGVRSAEQPDDAYEARI